MLKTSGIIESKIETGDRRVGVDSSSRAKRNGNELDGSKIDGNELRDDEVGKKV